MSPDSLRHGWTSVSLGELARPIRPRMDPRLADGLPFIGLEHIEPNTMCLLGTKRASDMKSSGFRFQPGDVLYGRLRPYLNKVHRPQTAGLASAEFIVLTPTERIDADYLAYLLSSDAFVRYASALNTGDRPRVDFGQIAKYPVSLPPIREQQRISALLGQLLTQVDESQRLIAVAAKRQCTLRKSVLQATRARTREWRTVTLPDVTINRDGRRVPVRRSDRARRQGTYPYYGASGIIDSIDDYLFDGDYLLVAEDGANLVSRSSPIAFIASGRFWVNNHAHVLEPTAEADLRFLKLALNAIDLGPYITGTAQPKLTQAALNRIELPLPSVDEQREVVGRIDEVASVADNARSLIGSAQARLRLLRSSLLRDGLNGGLA